MRNVAQNRIVIVAGLLAFGVSGCDLADNAKKSAENSAKAADNSSNLLDLNENAYGDGRQGATRDRREQALKTMFEASMVEAKLVGAAAYFNAFEYQLFKGAGFREDSEGKRDQLMADAVAEFLRTQKDFLRPDFAKDTLTALKAADGYGGRSVANLFAVASALHQVSARQIEASKRYGFELKSMLSLFADAMAAKTASDADPVELAKTTRATYEVLKQADDAALILQVRLNLLLGSAVGTVAQGIQMADGKTLTVTASAAQLADAVERVKAAVQVKGILAQAGIAPTLFMDVKGGGAKVLGALAAIPNVGMGEGADARFAPLRDIQAALSQLGPDLK